VLQTLLKGISKAVLGASDDAQKVKLGNGITLDVQEVPEVERFRRSPFEAIEDWYLAGLPGAPVGLEKSLDKVLVSELGAKP